MAKIFDVDMGDYLDDNNGICLSCGEIHYGTCEPDARRYPCESCGKKTVYGLEEALMMGRINVLE